MAFKFFVNGTTNNNWSSTSNWSLTSGGATGATVPNSADDVFFDNNSPNCFLDGTSVKQSASLTFTSGYTNQFTLGARIIVLSGLTLGANMLPISGLTGEFRIFTTGPVPTFTITTNGKSIPNLLIQNTTKIITLNDDLNISGMLAGSITPGTNLGFVGGKNINIYGWLDLRGCTWTGDCIFNYYAPYGIYTTSGGTISNTLNILGATKYKTF